MTGSFTKLKKLDISYWCSVGDKEIQKFIKLEELHAINNPNVTSLNHLTGSFTKLKKLDIGGHYCGVGDLGIWGSGDAQI